MFKRLVALIIVLTFSTSVGATSGDKPEVETPAESDIGTQQSETQQAEIQQAIQDATADVDMYTAKSWGVGSALASVCCPIGGGLIVMVMAQSQKPRLPIERLLGKTPAYVKQYTLTYRDGVKRKNGYYATGGMLVGSGISVLLIIGAINETERAVGDAIGTCLSPLSDACFFGF